jgi:acyl-homoserine lactone acylase PvdQ
MNSSVSTALNSVSFLFEMTIILRLYGQARGRAAQYWGEKYLESDRWVQTMGVPERARD